MSAPIVLDHHTLGALVVQSDCALDRLDAHLDSSTAPTVTLPREQLRELAERTRFLVSIARLYHGRLVADASAAREYPIIRHPDDRHPARRRA